MSSETSLLARIRKLLTPGPGRLINREGFLHSAVLMPMIEINGQWHLLFEKRAKGIRQGGELCFPGGRVEEGEGHDPASTVLRETSEELGLPGERIDLLGCLGSLVAPVGAAIDVYVGIVSAESLVAMKPDPGEVEETILWPIDDFMAGPPEFHSARIQMNAGYEEEGGAYVELLPVTRLGLPERYTAPWGVRDHRILVYRLGSEVLWGLTAEMVYGLCGLLAETSPVREPEGTVHPETICPEGGNRG